MSVAEDLRSYLVTQTVLTANNSFSDYMSDSPVDCACLYETAGQGSTITHDGAVTHRPDLQVTVRDSSADDCRTLLLSIEGKLHGLTNATISGRFYLSVRSLSGAIPLGKDSATGAYRMSQNYTVEWREA